jgi:hypothetical protein
VHKCPVRVGSKDKSIAATQMEAIVKLTKKKTSAASIRAHGIRMTFFVFLQPITSGNEKNRTHNKP